MSRFCEIHHWDRIANKGECPKCYRASRDSSTDRLEKILDKFMNASIDYEAGLKVDLDDEYSQAWKAIQLLITKASTNRAIEELENLREEVKHENLRTISQVITSRINQLKGEQ